MISSKLAVLTEQLYVTLESRFSIIGTISEILSVWLQHSAVFCLWQSEKYIAKYQHSANMMIRTMKVSKAVKRGLSTVIEQCSVTCWEIHFFVFIPTEYTYASETVLCQEAAKLSWKRLRRWKGSCYFHREDGKISVSYTANIYKWELLNSEVEKTAISSLLFGFAFLEIEWSSNINQHSSVVFVLVS